MANVFLARVWKIDTASATNISNDAPLTFNKIRVVGNVATDDIEIADGDGNVVWDHISLDANPIESNTPITVNGLRVPVLDGVCVLYLYHDVPTVS